MNSLVLAPFSRSGLKFLESLGHVYYEPWLETQKIYDPYDLADLLSQRDCQILIVEADFLLSELFESSKDLKFAAICRGELNQVDIEAATLHGITVIHTPGRNAQAVAELVVGQMFNLARHLTHSHNFVKQHLWENPIEPYLKFVGRELSSSTLGIIGLGNIGEKLANLAVGLKMRVLGYDPYRARNHLPGGVEITDLDTLLETSDFVTVHIPQTQGNNGLLNESKLSLMKHGAFLISSSHPSIIDIDALCDRLTLGYLAGVAVDVHETHPMLPNSPLTQFQNVLMTPHIGGSTLETIARHSQMVTTDLKRFLRGVRPKYLVNTPLWKDT